MEKTGWKKKIFRIVLGITSIPIVVIGVLAILLYIPPVQRFLIDNLCEEIGEATGYRIEVGSAELHFPLKLKTTGLKISKNNDTYLQSKCLDADISLLPLLTGNLEINYISIEDIDIHSHNIMESLEIDGSVGFVRFVVRDLNIPGSMADIRQLHIQEGDICITQYTTIDEEEVDGDYGMSEWIINLRNGNIKNCRVKYQLPDDSISTKFDIEDLVLKEGCVNTFEGSLALGEIALESSEVNYNMGNSTPEEAPLKHIELEKIIVEIRDIFYAKEIICANVRTLNLEQPGGLAITNATANLTSSNDTLRLQGLDVYSHNGSHLQGEFIIPREALSTPSGKVFTVEVVARLNKGDLAKFVAKEIYDELSIFDEDMFNAHVAMSGNINDIDIDTIEVQLPGYGTVNASGSIKEIIKRERANGEVHFNGNVAGIMAPYNMSVAGNLCYKNSNMDIAMTTMGEMGKIELEASYNITNTMYNACLGIDRLSLVGIIPEIPLHNLTMSLEAQGEGLEIFDEATKYKIKSRIDTLYYADYKFKSLSAEATQEDCVSSVDIEGRNDSLSFNILAMTRLKADAIENSTTIKLEKENSKKQEIELEFATTPEQTRIKIINGDLRVAGITECGYAALLTSADNVALMCDNIIDGNLSYRLYDFESVLPQMDLQLECGKENIIHNYLASNGIDAESMKLYMKFSPLKGVSVNGEISKFSNGDIELDSLKIMTTQFGDTIDYSIGINDIILTSIEEKNSYNATLAGRVSNSIVIGEFFLHDNVSKLDNKIGATAHFTPQNICLSFDKEALLLGKPFMFNSGNYIKVGKGMSLETDVVLKNNDNSGFHLYTAPDFTIRQNANLDIFKIELERISSSIPGMPNIAGKLSANIRYQVQDNSNRIECGMEVDSFAYNGNYIGEESLKSVYTSKKNDDGRVGITLCHDKKQVASINCILDVENIAFSGGEISFSQFPLAIANSFTRESGVILNGYVDSRIEFSGRHDKIVGEGYIKFDSTDVYISGIGTTLYPAAEEIKIENSQLGFNRFLIHDKANSPFIINGIVDFRNPTDPTFNLQLNAGNYEVMNTPRKRGKSMYGKLFIDLNCLIRGTMNSPQVYGNVAVLSNSNFAYVLPETAFETEKNLDGLVEFVDFNDNAPIEHEKQTEVNLGNMDVDLSITVKEGAKLGLDFDETHENYIIFDGDGTLNATYGQSGINVTGIYKLNSGELKLTLPIIPLKTFQIQEGGRLTWSGNLYNPTLDITALEKTTVSVELDDNSIQPTTFYTGVVLGNTVENISVGFTMSSPDNIIQEQLNQLDQETLSKYAVAMIITGTYLGGRQGVTATNALSSYLDAKINDLSGEAIKNFNVNFGIYDGLDTQTGSSYKNYAFSFSKRFLNDRITVVVGGEVDSGERPEKDAGNSSIINNVSLEWKLNDSGNRYMRIFYDKNYRSILEGEITETGIGYVYKRKLNKLKELFDLKEKKTPKKSKR